MRCYVLNTTIENTIAAGFRQSGLRFQWDRRSSATRNSSATGSEIGAKFAITLPSVRGPMPPDRTSDKPGLIRDRPRWRCRP